MELFDERIIRNGADTAGKTKGAKSGISGKIQRL